jgi:AraC-like DNA-binding protein
MGFHLGDSLIFNSASLGHRHTRDASLVRRTAIDHVMIEYQTAGRRQGTFGRRSVTIAPGDVSFLDFGRTVESEEPAFSRVSLIVPRDRLPRALRERDLHGIVLGASHQPARLLGRYLAALARSAGVLTLDQAADAVATAFALSQRAFGQAILLSPEQRHAARPALRRMAQDYIERNLARPGFAPSEIAAEIGVSRATLYRLFEPDGGIIAFLIARRLDRCFEALLRDRDGNSIGHIALSHGFSSEAHFSRAFRARFGVSARDVRAIVRVPDQAVAAEESGLAALVTMPVWVRELAERDSPGL